MDLFSELKRRNIFKVAIAYIALGWVVIQVTDMAVPALNLPETLNSIVFYLGMIGFPFALFFAWAFELTPDGVKRTEDVDKENSISLITARKLEHIIVGLLIIAVGFMIWENYLSTPGEDMEIAQSDPDAVAPTEIGKSIAVLPFVNMSDDKDYFADGLSEELLNLLAKNRDLKVAGRTSSFAFKGENRDLRQIGSELSVATILEGSVRRDGERIRITAQLINVEDGYHLWSETYDRELVDIFDIQDEVAKSITNALQVTLSGDETVERDRPTDNLEAYALYLEGIALTSGTLQSHRIALARFDEAVALDPEFAVAWTFRATVAYNFALFNRKMPSESMARSHAYAQDALVVDPDSVFNKALEVSSRGDDYSWVDDYYYIQLAIEAEPTNLLPKMWQMWNNVEAGYLRKSLTLGEGMIALDPANPKLMGLYAYALLANGKMEQARELLDKAIAGGITDAATFAFVDRLLQGDASGAIEIFEKLSIAHDGEDYSAVRTLVEAEFNDQPLDEELASQIDVGLDIRTLIDLGRGRLDKFMDDLMVLDMDAPMSSPDLIIYIAMTYPETGFTAHPRFLEVAQKIEMTELWEQFGPPDMCSKDSGEWVCR